MLSRFTLPRALAVALFLLTLAASSAHANVRLGPDLTPIPGAGQVAAFVAVGCQQQASYNPCIFVNHASSNSNVPLVAPYAGVITKWRFRGGCCTDPQVVSHTFTLRTTRTGVNDGLGGYAYEVPQNSGPSFVIPAGNVVLGDPPVELAARMPIAAGDRVGIAADYPIMMSVYSPLANVTSTVLFNGTVYLGQSYGNVFANTAMAINADLEPDVDGDGYGDETQDCFPADPGAHEGSCAPEPPPSPPPFSPAAGISCPAGTCSNGPSKGVTFSGAVSQAPPSPRSDGGIYVILKCPPELLVPCGGILYAALPEGKKTSTAGGRRLGNTSYSIKPGAKKKLKIKFSKSIRKFLAKKSKRVVYVTVQPANGEPVSTRVTLKFKH
ncbi:MAG: hypothetical protein ACRDKI_08950 [Solirubrobacterales bacterium]